MYCTGVFRIVSYYIVLHGGALCCMCWIVLYCIVLHFDVFLLGVPFRVWCRGVLSGGGATVWYQGVLSGGGIRVRYQGVISGGGARVCYQGVLSGCGIKEWRPSPHPLWTHRTRLPPPSPYRGIGHAPLPPIPYRGIGYGSLPPAAIGAPDTPPLPLGLIMI